MSESIEFVDNLIGSMKCCFILHPILKNNIPEKLVDCAKTVEELSEGTSIVPERFHRYLSLLEYNGIFSFDESTKKWSNTLKSSYFLEEFNKATMIIQTYPKFVEPWLDTEEVLSSKKNSFEIRGKGNLYSEIQKFPDWLNLFQDYMKKVTQRNFQEVVNAIDLSSVNGLLDVGGGDGSLTISLAKANPNVEFGVFELEEIEERAKKNIEDNNLAHRIQVFTGDFLESVKDGFDSICMKHIVHFLDDEKAVLLLKNCRKVLSPGNKLFIIDLVKEKNTSNYNYQLQLDLLMIHYLNGKERTLSEFEKLFADAGFKLENSTVVPFDNVVHATAI